MLWFCLCNFFLHEDDTIVWYDCEVQNKFRVSLLYSVYNIYYSLCSSIVHSFSLSVCRPNHYSLAMLILLLLCAGPLSKSLSGTSTFVYLYTVYLYLHGSTVLQSLGIWCSWKSDAVAVFFFYSIFVSIKLMISVWESLAKVSAWLMDEICVGLPKTDNTLK